MLELQSRDSESLYKLPVSRLVKEPLNAVRDFWTDLLGSLQLVKGRGDQCIQAPEVLCQQNPGPLSDKRYPEPVQHPRQRLLFRSGDICQNAFRRFPAHPLQLQQLTDL